MKFEYDPDADAGYLRFTKEAVHRTVQVNFDTLVDLDHANQAIGVEILFIQERIHEDPERFKKETLECARLLTQNQLHDLHRVLTNIMHAQVVA